MRAGSQIRHTSTQRKDSIWGHLLEQRSPIRDTGLAKSITRPSTINFSYRAAKMKHRAIRNDPRSEITFPPLFTLSTLLTGYLEGKLRLRIERVVDHDGWFEARKCTR